MSYASRPEQEARALKLRKAGCRPVEIAEMVGLSRWQVEEAIRCARDLGESFPKLKFARRYPPAYQPPAPGAWTFGALRFAMTSPHAGQWYVLANRLAWLYGEAEALKRLNGYAQERAAA